MQENKNKLLVIVGPTASGKSDLAVDLARKFDGEIISADSRQVYKYMDVGTGKITKKEMKGVPHHMLSIAHPRRQFTVAQYKKKADKIIADIQKRGKLPILVGGTGFYIQAVVDNLNLPEVPPNPTLRKKLEKLSTKELFETLKKKDPKRARSIQASNKRRLIRALEIIETLYKVPTADPAPRSGAGSGYDVLEIGVKWPQEDLNKRIEKRLDKRLNDIVRETKKLREDVGLSWKKLENFGLEYKWAALYLQDKISRQDMRENLLRDIKRYARRQNTWFKRDKRIKWIEPPQSNKKALKITQKWINKQDK